LLTCVTGVSGSGKSILVNDTLFSSVVTQFKHASAGTTHFDNIQPYNRWGLQSYFDFTSDQAQYGNTEDLL
jgi:excinuclease UvrABC ATPase subunit